jgi:hypothetical protein
MGIEHIRTVRISIGDARSTVARTVDTLESMLANTDLTPEMTVPFQIESQTIQYLLQGVVDEVVGIAVDESRPVVSIDLGGTLRTDAGFRTWGTVSLGALTSGEMPFHMVSSRLDEESLVLESGEIT